MGSAFLSGVPSRRKLLGRGVWSSPAAGILVLLVLSRSSLLRGRRPLGGAVRVLGLSARNVTIHAERGTGSLSYPGDPDRRDNGTMKDAGTPLAHAADDDLELVKPDEQSREESRANVTAALAQLHRDLSSGKVQCRIWRIGTRAAIARPVRTRSRGRHEHRPGHRRASSSPRDGPDGDDGEPAPWPRAGGLRHASDVFGDWLIAAGAGGWSA
jgi:hypothetical protein